MNAMRKNRKSKIFGIFGPKMATPASVIDEAFSVLPSERKTPLHIKSNFSGLIEELEHGAHSIYRNYETRVGAESLFKFFGLDEAIPVPLKFAELFKESFEELNLFFLSLAQSRKSRAGKAFEVIIKRLFKSLDYPFDEQVVINGKPDFLLPSEKHYRVHAPDCIIFTAKRTLRERWRQIVTEGIRGLAFYLATIDEKVTENALAEMKANRIYLVVPMQLKKSIDHYTEAPNVLTFETFFKQHLDPAMQRWKENSVI